MKNIVKIATLTLSFTLLIASTACSGGNTTSESLESSNEDIWSNVESSIVDESSETVSSNSEFSVYETTSTSENSVNSNISAVDPAVEERSYSDEEKYKEQDTKIPNYKYRPFCKEYIYSGNESKVIIPSDFTICPIFPQSTSTYVKEIIVPESVTKISTATFGGCSNLEKLVILNPDCEIEDGAIPYSKNSIGIKDDLKVYIYYNSDKSPMKSSRFANDSKCVNFFFGKIQPVKEESERLLDLATESYE